MAVRNLNLFGGLREIGEDMSRCERSSVDMEVEMERKEQGSEERRSNGDDCSGSDMRWEKFIPIGVVRVLLVEADDSTRRIISAYLRKCNYKVAAVADGLKAWEVLKERPHKIDLILAEVDLPSISGFSLLSLIMEDDYCRNVPVIMMSTQDSIGTVYECMMRGASDFLMKPIRINVLKHVWQHIWRRKSSCCLDLDKGAKSASAEEQPQELTGSEKMRYPAIGAEDEGLCSGSSTMAIEKTATTADNSSRTEIDLIGTFDNKDRHVDQQSNNNTIVLESPALNLSLSRSELSGFVNKGHQSDALAFPWYTNEGSGSLPNEAQMALPVCHERKVENTGPVTDHSGSDSVCQTAQREAALTKFRLKRKERCFEKKVRYESRKKLADTRPRIKGQFVRRIPNSPASAGNYLANERPLFCFSVNY